eukprot:COSAG06_NODE_59522_length_274_cov_0.554286_1_plen_56_part_01
MLWVGGCGGVGGVVFCAGVPAANRGGEGQQIGQTKPPPPKKKKKKKPAPPPPPPPP